MLSYQGDSNYLPIEPSIPWQINELEFKKRSQEIRSLYQTQFTFDKLDTIYIDQEDDQQIFDRIGEIREKRGYVPYDKSYFPEKRWKERTKSWEFDNEADYDSAFANKDRGRCYKQTKVPRFEVNIISLDYKYYYPLFIPSNVVLGSVINCVVKHPIYEYHIYNTKYLLSYEILEQKLVELYERCIEFRFLIVEHKSSQNKIFGSQFYTLIPPLDQYPKIYNFNHSISIGKLDDPNNPNYVRFPPNNNKTTTNHTTDHTNKINTIHYNSTKINSNLKPNNENKNTNLS